MEKISLEEVTGRIRKIIPLSCLRDQVRQSSADGKRSVKLYGRAQMAFVQSKPVTF